jgi:hypothetical protein
MPNPKDYIGEDYVFVPGHVRRKSRRMSRRRARNPYDLIAGLIVLGILGGIVLWVVETFWILIIIAFALGVILLGALKWKKWRLRFLNWRIHKVENKNELNYNLREADKKFKNLKR